MIGAISDEHVPGPLVQALRRHGMDVVTIAELQRQGMDDAVILEKALLETRIVLTNETDFLSLASAAQERGLEFAPILFWPQQQRTMRHLLSQIIPIANQPGYAAICSKVFFL